MWSWEVEGREKLFSRILCYSLVCESAWVIFKLLAQVLVSPWKNGSYFSYHVALSSLGRDDLGFLLFLLQLSSDFSSHNYPPTPRQQTLASPSFSDLHCSHPFLSAKTDACWPTVTEGATATGPYSLTEKRQRRKSRLLHLNPKNHQKKIPELENLRSFQSFLDSLKKCSPFLWERGQQCDHVAPWAHWQNKRNLLFQKEHKKGPRIERERERERERTPEVS